MEESRHFEALYPEDTRESEIKQIVDYIKSGRSSQVVGLPGTGRGNLLGMLAYNKNVRLKHFGENYKWFHFVYMDFSEVRKRDLFEVVKFMLISVSYSLLERGMKEEYEKVNEFLKEAISFEDEMILFQALKKSIDYLSVEKELTVIFLFDRFEQYIPNITEEFFLNLKILRNRAKYRFSCIFSLSRPIEEILESPIFTEFYEFLSGNIVFLDIYDPIGLNFRFSYLEKVTGKKKEAKIKEEIVKIVGGHVKLARIAYETVLSEEKPKQYANLEEYLLEKNVIKRVLFDIWNQLNPSEQILLKNISKGNKDTDDKAHKYLENVGLLKEEKITIPIFEHYIEDIEVEKDRTISFDAERNEILKQGVPITEKLSPSEFRLLKFLLQNHERVCEKDEVISAVWKDSKTQEGVTDQALDQIIYRLRKKIEEDPNNPVHLQTVKGRGFKFSP